MLPPVVRGDVWSATNGPRALSCWMRTVVLGKTKQSSRIGPEFRHDGWLAAQRNAPIVTHSVEKTTRSTAGDIGRSYCMTEESLSRWIAEDVVTIEKSPQ
jgi:hypothetical protein